MKLNKNFLFLKTFLGLLVLSFLTPIKSHAQELKCENLFATAKIYTLVVGDVRIEQQIESIRKRNSGQKFFEQFDIILNELNKMNSLKGKSSDFKEDLAQVLARPETATLPFERIIEESKAIKKVEQESHDQSSYKFYDAIENINRLIDDYRFGKFSLRNKDERLSRIKDLLRSIPTVFNYEHEKPAAFAALAVMVLSSKTRVTADIVANSLAQFANQNTHVESAKIIENLRQRKIPEQEKALQILKALRSDRSIRDFSENQLEQLAADLSDMDFKSISAKDIIFDSKILSQVNTSRNNLENVKNHQAVKTVISQNIFAAKQDYQKKLDRVYERINEYRDLSNPQFQKSTQDIAEYRIIQLLKSDERLYDANKESFKIKDFQLEALLKIFLDQAKLSTPAQQLVPQFLNLTDRRS